MRRDRRGGRTGLGAAALRHRPGPVTGLAAAAVAVAAATGAIYFLRRIAPVVSLDVVYIPAVLLISTYWGRTLGLLTSLLSAAAFNFFHLPPTGRFTIFNDRNWVALGVFTIVALAASSIAELARSRAAEAERRRAEADLAAGLAHQLLLGTEAAAALRGAARGVADALGLDTATITEGAVAPAPGQLALPLRGPDRQQEATLLVDADLPADAEQRLRTQLVPTLEALVAIARRRDALQAELVETEALRRSDEMKTALLRAVSHDLRTPLTAIVAAGHALGAGSLTGQERDELSAAVVDEGGRLAGLVDNLLALSRLQAGSATPHSDWVSVEDLISAATEGLRGGPFQVRVDIDSSLPEVRADAAQLERAFANLIENGARYGGGKPVSVRARRAADCVLVEVSDRGPGIDESERERIFQPFYRIPERTPPRRASRGPAGSGLGLAIVKGFVEANGGSISVQPRDGGGGTTFTVSLPVADRGAPTAGGAGARVA